MSCNKIQKMIYKKTLLCILIFLACAIEGKNTIKISKYKQFAHNPSCYSQGLFFLNSSHIFQSCGLYNKSFYHILSLPQLKQTSQSPIPLNSKIFLQGSTYLKKTNKIYILTWRQNKVYQIDMDNFQVERELKWEKDGWGLTSNQTHLFVTDGSSQIFLADQQFNIIQAKIIVDQDGKTLYNINQLQLVTQDNKQYIYANVYMQRRILKIDYSTAKVVQQFDLLKVIQNQKGLKYDEVLNGIAFNANNNKFILTGKNWAYFYQVDLK